jgi:hypothetical protein
VVLQFLLHKKFYNDIINPQGHDQDHVGNLEYDRINFVKQQFPILCLLMKNCVEILALHIDYLWLPKAFRILELQIQQDQEAILSIIIR